MAIDKINVIQSSKNFDGNLASFLRWLDNPQALGRYIMDSAYDKSFFSNFPGLVYRIDDPRVTFLLFGSGKIICTGGRSIQDVKRAVAKADKKLRNIKPR